MDKVELDRKVVQEVVDLLRELRGCKQDNLANWRYFKDPKVLDLLVVLAPEAL